MLFDGYIPKEIVEDIVINVSVFIDPSAKDYRKIYQYNYGATKLAIRRAMADYPSIEKVLAEKYPERLVVAIIPDSGERYLSVW